MKQKQILGLLYFQRQTGKTWLESSSQLWTQEPNKALGGTSFVFGALFIYQRQVRLSSSLEQDAGGGHLWKYMSGGCLPLMLVKVMCSSFFEGWGKNRCNLVSGNADLIQTGKESRARLSWALLPAAALYVKGVWLTRAQVLRAKLQGIFLLYYSTVSCGGSHILLLVLFRRLDRHRPGCSATWMYYLTLLLVIKYPWIHHFLLLFSSSPSIQSMYLLQK